MKRYLIITTLALTLGALSLQAQDSTKVCPPLVDTSFRLTCTCGCHYHPHNNYSGLNSLRARLADPSWDGKGFRLPDIGTGLRFEDGRIRPLARSSEKADPPAPVTSSAGSIQASDIALPPYLQEIGRGEVPLGPPVFVFFRLAGTHVTDSPQILAINAAADLAVARNLKVRITGSADSATGTPGKNEEIAKARAEHVASLMEKRGVPRERMEVLSEGGTANYEPVSANRHCRIELFLQ
jgi:flagellar motor protein MotB